MKQKAGLSIVFLILALILAAFASVFLLRLPVWIQYRRGDIKDYNLAQPRSLQAGDLVQGTVDMNLGSCAEEYITKTAFGVQTSDKSRARYYVLWLDCGTIMLYEAVNEDEYAALDEMARQTDAYFASLNTAGDAPDVALPQTTLKITGQVREIPEQVLSYFREWYGDEHFEDIAEPYMISALSFDGLGISVLIGLGLAALCITMLVLAIVLRSKAGKEAPKTPAREENEGSGF